MGFEVKNLQKSVNDIMRTIGYHKTYFQPDISRRSEERSISIVRQIGKNDYPRFHLYIKEKTFDAGHSAELSRSPQSENQNKILIFNLHLDQKKPSYKGSHAHSGEYDGKLVKEEAERIKSLLK